ncbi:MAG: hypothetical protein E7477_05175 [Ruminococcaceae bacterium]|nr:hypothetical protein [Oscillospiraceae bacterium]
MGFYNRFLALNIDIWGNGIEKYEYFCTPKGADIIGFEGVDGIHYCFIRGFGETVFAVSPSNTPGDYVHPIARSFEDFLGLIVACKGTAAIEQAHGWDKAMFDDFVEHSEPDTAKLSAIEKVSEKLPFNAIIDPYFYIKDLQSSFDYGKIKFNPDYYETLPDEYLPEPYEWKVYFNEGFWTHRSRSRAGEELRIDKKIEWADEIWHIPSVYKCSKGLVVDFCIEIDPDKVDAFLEKWLYILQYDSNIDRATREQIENENPLDIDFLAKFILNGSEIQNQNGCSLNWMPDSCRPSDVENTKESKRVIDHYGLDSTRAWVFYRMSVEYNTAKKPQLNSLDVQLKQQLIPFYSERFLTPAVGETVEIKHPFKDEKYTLTVSEIEKKTVGKLPEDDGWELPTKYTAMSYTVSLDLANSGFSVRYCLDSEAPRVKKTSREKNLFSPTASNDFCAVGFIGGADGPTAILFSHGQPETASLHIACSSLRFEHAENIEWQAVFREKLRNDIDVKII